MYYYSRVETTCFIEANIEYYKFNKYFSDFEGKNEIDLSSIPLKKLKHVLSDFIVDRKLP